MHARVHSETMTNAGVKDTPCTVENLCITFDSPQNNSLLFTKAIPITRTAA